MPLIYTVINLIWATLMAVWFFNWVIYFKVNKTLYYRPQCSCGKVMFSQASVILFTEGGVCPGGECVWQTPPRQTPPWADTLTPPLARHTPPPDRHRADTPPGQTPPRQTPTWQTPPSQTPPSRHPPRDGYCSGRYASYWNAFLFYL